MKILIVDNNIDQPWGLCADFRRYLLDNPKAQVVVRRAPQEDLPKDLKQFTHVILSGSKTSCTDSSPWVQKLIQLVNECVELEIPLLGVCYGHQIIARTFGSSQSVGKSLTPEFGWVEIKQDIEHPLLKGLPDKFHSFQAHFEEVKKLPDDFVVTAQSERCSVQAFYHKEKPIFGVQFHPERNAEEGQDAIDQRKKFVSSDCIFNDGRAKSVFTENVANTIFRNFLSKYGQSE